MRIIFMGTPEFSVPCLEALINSNNEVVGVFTQPDKPKGRGYEMTPPPVKVCATEHNIPVFQPVSMRNGEALEIINSLNADLIIVVAFGKILPKEILESVKYGCINIHASLLPKLRGAAPIQWSIINGETESGVTSMQMDVGLDTGDMLIKKHIPITENMNAGELHDALSVMG
ncbi:MAG: methionyl-tRNA formyltransferase, partial [Clostridia bacterium]|nr:methionyl-tRNA formyltransferase [Clostridia bacterium]